MLPMRSIRIKALNCRWGCELGCESAANREGDSATKAGIIEWIAGRKKEAAYRIPSKQPACATRRAGCLDHSIANPDYEQSSPTSRSFGRVQCSDPKRRRAAFCLGGNTVRASAKNRNDSC